MKLLDRVRSVMDRIRGAAPDGAGATDALPPRMARAALEEKPVGRGAAEFLAEIDGRLGAQSARAQHLLEQFQERLDSQVALAVRLSNAVEELGRLGQEFTEARRTAEQVAESVVQHLDQVASRDQAMMAAIEEVARRSASGDLAAREMARQIERTNRLVRFVAIGAAIAALVALVMAVVAIV